MHLLITLIPNVTELTVDTLDKNLAWIPNEVLSKWKLTKLKLCSYAAKLIFRAVESWHELTHIDIKASIDDTVITAIAENCPKLEVLNPSYGTYTYKSFQTLSEKNLPMKELGIENLPVFPTADAVIRCAHAISRLSTVRTKQLLPNYSLYNNLVPLLTGPTFISLESPHDHEFVPLLIQHCQTLTYITITRENNVSPPDLFSLCCGNPLLWNICNFSVPMFSNDAQLLQLLQACPLLRELSFHADTLLTDISLLALSEHCPGLESLDIRNCAAITDTGVIALVEHCPNMKNLNISECTSVTKAAVSALLKSCRKLRRLGIPKRSYSCYMFDDYQEISVHVGETIGEGEEISDDEGEFAGDYSAFVGDYATAQYLMGVYQGEYANQMGDYAGYDSEEEGEYETDYSEEQG